MSEIAYVNMFSQESGFFNSLKIASPGDSRADALDDSAAGPQIRQDPGPWRRRNYLLGL